MTSSPAPRNTRQRSLILKTLEAKKGPVSVPEICKVVSRVVPSLNKTTVYRTLERLEKEGLIESIMLQEGVIHYELKTHDDDHHHHHFVCQSCEKIFCLSGCLPNMNRLLPKGFKLVGHDLTLRGICRDCA